MHIFAVFLILFLFIAVGAGLKPATTTADDVKTRPALNQNSSGPALNTKQAFWSWYHARNPLREVPATYPVNRGFWTWYLQTMPPEDVRVKATCRGIGQNLYVFVNDEDWQRPVTQEDVDRIIEAFDRSSPANPHKGIYQIATEVFGSPPDKDGDPRIYILISELGEFRGHHFDGFFRYIDQTNEKGSNQLDMLYVDAHDPSSEYHIGVLAHEFQHLIHWRYDPEEEGWANEALSEVCMILCGYYTDKRHVETFLKHPDRALVTTAHGATSYGACLLWATYIYDRLGPEFLGRWVGEPAHGVKGFEDALKHMAYKDTFNTLFADWMVTLYLNNPKVQNGRYAYKSLSLPFGPLSEGIASYPVEREAEINGYGIDYVRFILPESTCRLKIKVKGDSSNFLIKAIEFHKEYPLLIKISEFHAEEANILVDYDNSAGNNGRIGNEKEVILAVTVLEEREEPFKYSFSAIPEVSMHVEGLGAKISP